MGQATPKFPAARGLGVPAPPTNLSQDLTSKIGWECDDRFYCHKVAAAEGALQHHHAGDLQKFSQDLFPPTLPTPRYPAGVDPRVRPALNALGVTQLGTQVQ